MPAILEGTSQQITNNLDVSDNVFSKDTIKQALASTKGVSQEEKKLLDALGNILIQYNDKFNSEHHDRISLLKALIQSEYSLFLDHIDDFIKSSKDISDSSSNVDTKIEEAFKTEIQEKISKLEGSFVSVVDKAEIFKKDILTALQELIDVVDYNKEKYEEAIVKLKNSSKVRDKQANEFKAQYNKAIETIKDLQKKIELYKKRSNESTAEKLEKQEEYYKKKIEKIKTSAKNSLDKDYRKIEAGFDLLHNAAIHHNKFLTKNYQRYLELSKAFRYPRGRFELFLKNTGEAIKRYSAFIKNTRLVSGIISGTKRFGHGMAKLGSTAFSAIKKPFRYIGDSYLFYKFVGDPIKSLAHGIAFTTKFLAHKAKKWTLKLKDKIASKLNRVMLAMKSIKLTGTLLGFILAPLALVSGVMLKTVSIALNGAIKTISFVAKALLFGISAAINIAKSVVSFMYTKIIKPVFGKIMKGLSSALSTMLEVSKRTITSILAGFFATQEGAYVLGFTFGFLWEKIRSNFGTKEKRDELFEIIKNQLKEYVKTAIEYIKDTKAYRAYERIKNEYGAKIINFVQYLKGIIYSVKEYLIDSGRWQKIQAGFNFIAGLVGIAGPAYGKTHTLSREIVAATNTTKVLSKIPKVGKAFKSAAKTPGWIMKLIGAIVAVAAVGGALAIGLTQEPTYNANDNSIKVSARYRYLYGKSASEGIKGSFEGFKKLMESKPSKYTAADIAKLQGFTGKIYNEFGEVEELEDQLKEIKEAYEKQYEVNDKAARLAWSARIGPTGPEGDYIRMVNMFSSVYNRLLNSPLFGALDVSKLVDTYVLSPHNASGNGYRKWEFGNDIAAMLGILNFRKQQLNVYLDAYNMQSEAGLDALMELQKNGVANFNKDLATFVTVVKDSDWSSWGNAGHSVQGMIEHVSAKLDNQKNSFQSRQAIDTLPGLSFKGNVVSRETTVWRSDFEEEMDRISDTYNELLKGEYYNGSVYDPALGREVAARMKKYTIQSGTLASADYFRFLAEQTGKLIDAINPIYKLEEFSRTNNIIKKWTHFSPFRSTFETNILAVKKDIEVHRFEDLDTSSPINLAQSAIQKAWDKTLQSSENIDSNVKAELEKFQRTQLNFDKIIQDLQSIQENNAFVKAVLAMRIKRNSED